MRHLYLFKPAVVASSVPFLEDAILRLNSAWVARSGDQDDFCLDNQIWEHQTGQGIIYELTYSIISEELRRLVPILLGSFRSSQKQYNTLEDLNSDFPEDCNALLGFTFTGLGTDSLKSVIDTETYKRFVSHCRRNGHVTGRHQMRENLKEEFPHLLFEERAVTETLEWKNSDAKQYSRLLELLDDIKDNPFDGGLGRTEVLSSENGRASKRLNQKDRVVYTVKASTIIVSQCCGHYDDH